jgi:putative molybdopterin biosynthesis protein
VCGRVSGRMLFYPVEASPLGELPHDGLGRPEFNSTHRLNAERTLVMVGCDPAVGLLARMYEQATGYRMLVFSRSSRQALELLREGLVHVAGVHLSAAEKADGNAIAVKQMFNGPVKLLRIASWEDGVAVGSSVSAQSVRGIVQGRVTWIGREPGSGARQCFDELLPNRPAPRRLARDHRGVAEAIRCGWADAGVCLKLVAEEAGLRFLPVRTEAYDLCFARSSESDPRVQALVRVIQSREYRHLVGELPGYDMRHAGEVTLVD